MLNNRRKNEIKKKTRINSKYESEYYEKVKEFNGFYMFLYYFHTNSQRLPRNFDIQQN